MALPTEPDVAPNPESRCSREARGCQSSQRLVKEPTEPPVLTSSTCASALTRADHVSVLVSMYERSGGDGDGNVPYTRHMAHSLNQRFLYPGVPRASGCECAIAER